MALFELFVLFFPISRNEDYLYNKNPMKLSVGEYKNLYIYKNTR